MNAQLLQVYKMYLYIIKKITNIQWTRTEVSSSPAPPLKNSQNLHNPLWRALASKPLNRL